MGELQKPESFKENAIVLISSQTSLGLFFLKNKIGIGFGTTLEDIEDRPSMKEVVERLESIAMEFEPTSNPPSGSQFAVQSFFSFLFFTEEQQKNPRPTSPNRTGGSIPLS